MRTKPQPAERPDGRERLLQATVRHLEEHSAAQLRVTAIAAEADVAIGLIRHHFGSRDGMVSAAQLRRVEGATREDLTGARTLLEASDTASVLAGVEALTRTLIDRHRAAVRLSRVAAVATAHGRPEARSAIGETFGELLDDLTALLHEARERGLIAPVLPARAIATFIQSYALGLIIHDLDPTPCDDDDLTRTVMTAVRALLTPA